MNTHDKIIKLQELRDKIPNLLKLDYNDAQIVEWKEDVQVALKKIFNDEEHLKCFNDSFKHDVTSLSLYGDNFPMFQERHIEDMKKAQAKLSSMIKELTEWPDEGIDKQQALKSFINLAQRAINFRNVEPYSASYKQWYDDVECALVSYNIPPKYRDTFQKTISKDMPANYDFMTDFSDYLEQLNGAVCVCDSILQWIKNNIRDKEKESDKTDVIGTVTLLGEKFHNVVKQLRQRHDDRPTLDVADEYDVQDLFHAILTIYFDDIRPEEWTPSYAGGSSRMDFLLDDEGVVIELKMTRKSLGTKEAREQLIIDKEQYKVHPKCKHLICFVYDPEGRIKNPRGFEKDLSQPGEHPVTVYVRP